VFNLQGSEIVMILLIALVVLGPEKLPDAVRKFTQTYAELKKMSSGFQSELKSALDEPMREMRETAGLVRKAADPTKLIAEMEDEERLLRASEAAAASTEATEPAPSDPETADPGPGDADTTTSDGAA
jgi:sec-independent protein translocase protein TatB